MVCFPDCYQRAAARHPRRIVHVGDDWLPAVVDRSRQVAVEAMLLHDVIADEEFTGIGSAVSPESEPGTAAANLEPKRAVSRGIDRPDPKLTGEVSQLPASR